MLMSYRTLKSWVNDIFEMTSDYEEAVLTEDDYDDIISEFCDQHMRFGYSCRFDERDIEREINLKLQQKGYKYYEDECIWLLPDGGLKSRAIEVFKKFKDYRYTELTKEDVDDIAIELSFYDEVDDDDIIEEINAVLVHKGYEYNTDDCVWESQRGALI